jgi:hypothetical protein
MKLVKFVFCLLVLLSGCAANTPTHEVRASYAIYDIKAPEVPMSRIADAVKVALQKQTNGVEISQGIPPSPLPEKPGRFKVNNPYANGPLATEFLYLHPPTCEGAIVTAIARNSAMSNYGENTIFFLCLMPYRGGYHLDFYTTFSISSGGFSTQALGAALARGVVGDTSKFIPRTIASVVDSIQTTGATVSLVESYPN